MSLRRRRLLPDLRDRRPPRTPRPTTSAGHACRRGPLSLGSRTCSSRPCSPPPRSQPTLSISPSFAYWGFSDIGYSRLSARTSTTSARSSGTEYPESAAGAARSSCPATARRQPRGGPGRGGAPERAAAAQQTRRADGPARRNPPPPAPATGRRSLARMHLQTLRHTFVTTMLDAGVDLREIQMAARHADPRTSMRCDRARKNLDRHRTTAWRRTGHWAAQLTASAD